MSDIGQYLEKEVHPLLKPVVKEAVDDQPKRADDTLHQHVLRSIHSKCSSYGPQSGGKVVEALGKSVTIGKLEDVKGKVAFITGASSGMGYQTALVLAKAGMKVVLTARRVDKLQQGVDEIKAAGGEAMLVKVDVTKEEDIENAFAEVEKAWGGVDLVMANAGYEGDVATNTLVKEAKEIKQVVDVNLTGLLLTYKHGITAMKKRGGGVMVYISSIGAYVNKWFGGPMSWGMASMSDYMSGALPYIATKAAVDCVGRISYGLLAEGIRTYTINPGCFSTDMVQNTWAPWAGSEDAFAAFNPHFKSKCAHPIHIANVMLTMANNTTHYPPGSGVCVDHDATIPSEILYCTIENPLPASGWPAPEALKPYMYNYEGSEPYPFTHDPTESELTASLSESGGKKNMFGQEPAKDKVYEPVCNSLPSLAGKCFAITGTTSGTGYWTAITAVNKGAECVMMLNRNSSRADSAQDAVSKIAAEAGGRTKVVTISCDLQSFASVREAAAEVTKTAAKYGGLDGLLNNAGIMGMPDKRTDDGYDCQMQTNHLSHFLLTSLVMGSLNDAAAVRGESRVVQHSSGARGVKIIPIPGDGNLEAKYMQKSAAGELGGDDVMGSFTRYHQTKLANTVYCMTLHEKLTTAGSKVKSVCCEPGTCDTSLAGNLMNAHSSNGSSDPFKAMFGQMATQFVLQSASDGACPLIMAAFSADTNSGDMYMPVSNDKGVKGMPTKCITAGRPSPAEDWIRDGFENEALTMNTSNRNLLWRESETAVGAHAV